MFFFVNLTAGAILLTVDGPLFGRRESSAVCLAICSYILVNVLFGFLGSRSFRWRHLAVANTVGDALLLDISARADFIIAVLACWAIVLVVVNRLAEVILLSIDLSAFLRCERAAVGRPIVVNFLIQAGLAAFQIFRFARRQLPGGNPIGDASLLVVAASVH